MVNRLISGSRSANIEKLTIVRGIALTPRSPTMDRFLSEEDKRVLYSGWQKDWDAPISLRGGGSLITTAMVRKLAWGQLVKAYGPKQAKIFKDIAAGQS